MAFIPERWLLLYSLRIRTPIRDDVEDSFVAITAGPPEKMDEDMFFE